MSKAGIYQNFVTVDGYDDTAASPVSDFERQLARARGQAHADGIKEGAEHAQRLFDDDLMQRIETVRDGLSRMAAERAVSDAACLTLVQRIVAETITAFAPILSSAALPDLVAEKISKALEAELKGEITIEMEPNGLSDLESEMAIRDARVKFRERPDVPAGTARVYWRGGFDEIDPAAAIAAGSALLAERLTPDHPIQEGT